MARQRPTSRGSGGGEEKRLDDEYVRDLAGREPVATPRLPEYVLLPELEPAAARSSAVRQALTEKTIDAVCADAPTVPLVQPDQVLARRRTAKAKDGAQGRLVVRSPGTNVREEGNALVATRLGYLVVRGAALSVVPALWVSPDAMEAYLLDFSSGSREVFREQWLTDLAADAGIAAGLDVTASEAPGRARVAARGRAPVHGEAGRPEFTADLGRRAGKILADGTIDLRERNATVAVRTGDEVGILIPPTQGVAGFTVRGEPLPAEDGGDCPLAAGEGIRAEPVEGGRTRLVAEADGVIAVKDGEVRVNSVFVVNGDVDYAVGNIESGQDVQIIGTVRSGFEVRAGGSVTIGGVVEAGAEVHAGGDVVVARGILGQDTKVAAQGDVTTRFVQNATVMARGDLTVGSYLYNAQVRTGGSVVVKAGGGERGGSIVGGQVIAAERVVARRLGSGSTDHTVVGVRPRPELAHRLEKAQEAIAYCESNALRILRTLGINTPSADALRQLLTKATPLRRQQLTKLVRQLSELLHSKERAVVEATRAESEMEQALAAARIIATDAAMANVELRIGAHSLVREERLSRPRFAWSRMGIVEIDEKA